MDASEVLARWQGRDTVPLSEVARAVNMTRPTQDFAVREGFIKPLGERRQGKAHVIGWDEVVLIVAAAALAYTAGVAITAVLKILRESGATIAGGNVVIPVGGVL